MTTPQLPAVMDKCVRHVGGTRAFYYANGVGGYTLLDPEGEVLTTGVTESHFKKCYLPYSVNLPPAILAMLDAMPNYRDWRMKREKDHA